jgi:Tfp pilus assembly protein PilF
LRASVESRERFSNTMRVRKCRRNATLDPNLAETQTALAILACRGAQWLRCDELFKRALRRDPSDADARGVYAYWLAGAGYLDEAFSAIPISP